MTRPAGKPILWSTDANFDEVGKPWHNTPTKVRPSDGIQAAGYQPDRRRPAVHDNYKEHDAGRRLRHLDMVDVRNWAEPAPNAGAIATQNTAPHVSASPFPDGRILSAGNDDTLRASYDGGYSWEDEVTPAGASVEFRGVASSTTTAAAIVMIDGQGSMMVAGTTDPTWGGQTVTGCNNIRCVTYDSYEGCFWVGGTLSFAGDPPRLWRYTEAGGTVPMTESTVNFPGGAPAEPVGLIAASPIDKLAAIHDGPTQSYVYVWEDGDAATVDISPNTDHVRLLQWLPEDERFLVATSDGTDTLIYQKASQGSIWTLIETLNDVVFKSGADTAVIGSVVVAAATYGGRNYLAVSSDAGLSWELLPDPVRKHGGSPTPTAENVGSLRDRFMCTGYKSAGNAYSALSLRIRES